MPSLHEDLELMFFIHSYRQIYLDLKISLQFILFQCKSLIYLFIT